MSYSELIQSAIKVMQQAYAPYSKFRVGAAIVTENGEVFTGCNVETSSYSLTICAERVALFKAISEGHRNFKAIAIVSDTGEYCPPCGACRQVLWDIAKDIDIILAKNAKDYKVEKLSQLLPRAFDHSYLQTSHHNNNDK
jgi:cytidine deaminase